MQDTDRRDKREVLNSWKEIAVYLGRGVRTVQRWEANLGLPVHRPNGHLRSAVVAFSSELDEWLRKAPQLRESMPAPSTGKIPAHFLGNGHSVQETILECQKLRRDCLSSVSSFRKTAEAHYKLVGALINCVGQLRRQGSTPTNNVPLQQTSSSPGEFKAKAS
jgi:hypothetical protein